MQSINNLVAVYRRVPARITHPRELSCMHVGWMLGACFWQLPCMQRYTTLLRPVAPWASPCSLHLRTHSLICASCSASSTPQSYMAEWHMLYTITRSLCHAIILHHACCGCYTSRSLTLGIQRSIQTYTWLSTFDVASCHHTCSGCCTP